MYQLSSDDPNSEHSGLDAPLEEIALRALKLDQNAFAMLYEYYKKPLGKRLFALVGDQETAYDLYQEIFIRIWKYFSRETDHTVWANLRPWRHFEPWFYRTARNHAIDYLRHNLKFRFLPLPEYEPHDPSEIGSIQLSTNGHEELVCELLCLKEALAKMSEQYRVCLLLQVQWGLTQREIALELGISVKAVSTNVSRGYKQLRKIYKQMMDDQHNPRKGG